MGIFASRLKKYLGVELIFSPASLGRSTAHYSPKLKQIVIADDALSSPDHSSSLIHEAVHAVLEHQKSQRKLNIFDSITFAEADGLIGRNAFDYSKLMSTEELATHTAQIYWMAKKGLSRTPKENADDRLAFMLNVSVKVLQEVAQQQLYINENIRALLAKQEVFYFTRSANHSCFR